MSLLQTMSLLQKAAKADWDKIQALEAEIAEWRRITEFSTAAAFDAWFKQLEVEIAEVKAMTDKALRRAKGMP